MTRRLARAVTVLSIVAGSIHVFAAAAEATKVLERWQGTTSELKEECADQGGDFVGTKSGKRGVCNWGDGTFSTCDDTRKGKNCNTQGRVVTEDGEFLDFLTVALADPSAVGVVPGDGTAADGRKKIGGLLDKEDFAMTVQDLEGTCTNANADLITHDDDPRALCLGGSATIFCDTEQDGKNCTIEAVKKSTRRWLQLLRRALVDPSSVTIVVPSSGAPPQRPSEPTTTTTEPPTTTTEPSTTTTTTSDDPFLL